MSRIILSRYPDGQERVVVGYDHPAGGCFWQEFRQEPEDDDFEAAMEKGWTEMIREGGLYPGIPLDRFLASVPDDLRPLITPEVLELLFDHAADPDSGYGKPPVDLSRR